MKRISFFVILALLLNIVYILPVMADNTSEVVINIDDTDCIEPESSWEKSTTVKGYNNAGTYYSTGDIPTFKWIPNLAEGIYDVYIYNPVHKNNASSALVTVVHNNGEDYKQINQKTGEEGWYSLGEYEFAEGTDGYIMLSEDIYTTDGSLRASAVKFVPVLEQTETDGTSKKDEVLIITPTNGESLMKAGEWSESGIIKTSSGERTYYGLDAANCVWTPKLHGGLYRVSYYTCGNATDTATAAFDINAAGVSQTETINLQTTGWQVLGEYIFADETKDNVKMHLPYEAEGYLRISDIKFERICGNDVSAHNVSVKDKFGNSLSRSVNIDNSLLQCEGYVLNDTQKAIEVLALVGHYSNNDILKYSTYKKTSVLPYSVKKVAFQFKDGEIRLSDCGDMLKMFIWREDDITPLIKARSFDITEGVRREFYVSADTDSEGDGSIGNPFNSLDQVFERLQTGEYTTGGDITVFLRGGIYNIETPIEITQDTFDIGYNNLTIKAYNNETVTISGGKTVGHWQKVSGNVYKTFVGENTEFRQLYMDGKKQTIAREPDNDELLTESSGVTEWETDRIPVIKGYLDSVKDFTNQSVLCTSVTSWTNRRYRITGIDKNTSLECDYLILDDETLKSFQRLTPTLTALEFEASRCYFEGAYEFMDTPGEWILKDGYLYYYAEDGVNPNDIEFIYPYVNDNLVRLCGNVYDKVKNITFEGLTFSYTNWVDVNESGLIDIQANTYVPLTDDYIEDSQYRKGFKKQRVPAAVYGEYTENINIKNCVFTHIGGTGVSFEVANRTVGIIGNLFDDISGSGIEIGSDYYKAKDFRMYPSDIVIENNMIQNIANEYLGGCGITVLYADGVTVSHNYIKDAPYSGMSLGWGWDNSPPERHRNFVVKNNVIENVMQKLYDGGLFYTPDPINGTNVIEGNYLIGNERTMNPGSQQHGFYFDSSSSGWTLKNNVLANVPSNYSLTGQSDITIQNMYTNNSGRIIWGDEETYTVNGFYADKKVDWTTSYNGAAYEIIKDAGLEEHYKSLIGRDKFELYGPTPTYYVEENGETTVITGSVIIINKTGELQNAEISYETDDATAISPQTKNISLNPGENRVNFDVSFGSDIDFKLYPGVFRMLNGGDEYTIPVYVQTCPAENLTITIYDEGYSEVQGNWGVSGLPDTRLGSGADGQAAKAVYKPTLSSGTYEVWFYGVPNIANGLNPHNFVVVDNKGKEHITKIYQRTIPAGWNYMGTYELGVNSYVYLHQVGGGILRTSPVAFRRIDDNH